MLGKIIEMNAKERSEGEDEYKSDGRKEDEMEEIENFKEENMALKVI